MKTKHWMPITETQRYINFEDHRGALALLVDSDDHDVVVRWRGPHGTIDFGCDGLPDGWYKFRVASDLIRSIVATD